VAAVGGPGPAGLGPESRTIVAGRRRTGTVEIGAKGGGSRPAKAAGLRTHPILLAAPTGRPRTTIRRSA
jgi:hypothetical protein